MNISSWTFVIYLDPLFAIFLDVLRAEEFLRAISAFLILP